MKFELTWSAHVSQKGRFLQYNLLFAAKVVFLANIGPVRFEPYAADFEILRM